MLSYCVALKGRPFKYYICIYVDLKHLTFSYLILQSSYNWSNFFQGQFGSSFRYSRVENGICCAARATKSHVKQTFGKSISGTNFYFRFCVRPHNELKYGRKSINWQDNAQFASKAEINIFWKIFEWRVSEGEPVWMKKFQKTLILVFEVIVRPPKHTFEIGFFSRFIAHIVQLNDGRWCYKNARYNWVKSPAQSELLDKINGRHMVR